MYDFFVGIDVSKNSFSCCIIDSSQNPISYLHLPVSKKGFTQLYQKLLYLCKTTSTVAIAIESSGCDHFPLLYFLHKHNYPLFLLNPLLIKNFSSHITLRKTKTDKTDSYLIALFISYYHCQLTPFSNDMFSEFRELARERERLSTEIARVKNDIKKLLWSLFPELLQEQNPFCQSILILLKTFPSATAISSASVEDIHYILHHYSKGKTLSLSAEKIISLAKNSISRKSPIKELILTQKIDTLVSFIKKLKEIEQLLYKICSDIQIEDDIKIITSIKGIGNITALYFIAEVGDIRRFSTYKKLIAFAGMDPIVYESGQFKGSSRISKRGNRYLRRVLFLMAQKVVRFNTVFREYFLHRKNKDISYKKALMAVIHKLLRTIYSMLINKTMFNEQKVIIHNS